MVAAHEGREFWFDPEQESFLSRTGDGDLQLCGKVENFVYPIVPKAQHMQSYLGKAVTLFATRYLQDKAVKND